MLVILLTLNKTKNVSYFAGFGLLTQKCYQLFCWLWIISGATFFRWLLLTFLLLVAVKGSRLLCFCKFQLKWIPINWTFKVSPWFRTSKIIYWQPATFSVWPQSHTVWHKLKRYMLIHDFAVILLRW